MKRESFHRISRRWALLFGGVGFLLFLLQGGLLFRSGLEESKSDGDALLLAATHSFSLTLEGELDRASFLAADPERFASLAGELSLFARLEGDRLVQVIRGHLPRGFRLPGRAGMTDRWVISDLLNPDGVPSSSPSAPSRGTTISWGCASTPPAWSPSRTRTWPPS